MLSIQIDTKSLELDKYNIKFFFFVSNMKGSFFILYGN